MPLPAPRSPRQVADLPPPGRAASRPGGRGGQDPKTGLVKVIIESEGDFDTRLAHYDERVAIWSRLAAKSSGPSILILWSLASKPGLSGATTFFRAGTTSLRWAVTFGPISGMTRLVEDLTPHLLWSLAPTSSRIRADSSQESMAHERRPRFANHAD